MTTSEPSRPLVMVSGCFDLLHSGHVAFLNCAAEYGSLIVAVGSDSTVAALKGRAPICSDEERLYLVQSLRTVSLAFVSSGSGLLDFEPEFRKLRPDYFVVNKDGDHPSKRTLCAEVGAEYIVLDRLPRSGLPGRESSDLRRVISLPYRIEIAGGWLDQPIVSTLHPGPVIVASIEPHREYVAHSGLASSTRATALRLWGDRIPPGDPESLARDLFALENPPGKSFISGSQDALGLMLPRVTRLEYAGEYWPRSTETINDDVTLNWLESVLFLLPTSPRADDFNPSFGHKTSVSAARNLAESAERCWAAIQDRDLQSLGRSLCENLDAQVQTFPAMLPACVQAQLAKIQSLSAGAKFTGAGGGGYILVAADEPPVGAFRVSIRRTSG